MGRARRKLQHTHTVCRTDRCCKIQSAMRAQSQMVCREMERDEKSVRLKFSGCAEIKSGGRERMKTEGEGQQVERVNALEGGRKTNSKRCLGVCQKIQEFQRFNAVRRETTYVWIQERGKVIAEFWPVNH